MAQPFGHFLLNSVLPEHHRVSGTLVKKDIEAKMVAMAKEDPAKYVDVVTQLKRIGDDVSTLEGVSVGLEDITPMRKERDAILKPAQRALQNAKTQAERERIIVDAQKKIVELTKKHPGSMTRMAASGARGNFVQLAGTVSSPVLATDAHGAILPWIISRSYAEGLSAADHWVAGNQSRQDTVKSATSISEPGDMTKILVNNLYPMVVSKDDCGTRNGVAMRSDDSQIVDRFLSREQHGFHANQLVTPAIAAQLRKKTPTVYVRSPLTCIAKAGVCRHCQGLDEKGRMHAIGINVGVRAAQAISEPLTQMALGSKHGGQSAREATPQLRGISGLRQLLEVPQTFINKATLAARPGKVTKIQAAPHGGHQVWIGDEEHYVSPNLKLKVHVGQTVEAGDILSEGIPKPDELIHHKGFGAGRSYLVNTMHDIYRDQGIDVDKRHLELVTRADLNHVEILGHSDAHPELRRGTVVPYATFREAVNKKTRQLPLDKAVGETLGEEVFLHTVGTKLTPGLVAELKSHGVKTVKVLDGGAPAIGFLQSPTTRNPLLNPDWMARLSHRYLKQSLLDGARTGAESDRHGYHPVPAYAFGAEFGGGSEGAY